SSAHAISSHSIPERTTDELPATMATLPFHSSTAIVAIVRISAGAANPMSVLRHAGAALNLRPRTNRHTAHPIAIDASTTIVTPGKPSPSGLANPRPRFPHR